LIGGWQSLIDLTLHSHTSRHEESK